jgi:hypothetical protein
MIANRHRKRDPKQLGQDPTPTKKPRVVVTTTDSLRSSFVSEHNKKEREGERGGGSSKLKIKLACVSGGRPRAPPPPLIKTIPHPTAPSEPSPPSPPPPPPPSPPRAPSPPPPTPVPSTEGGWTSRNVQERVAMVRKLKTEWEGEIDNITLSGRWMQMENLTKEVSDLFNKIATVKNRKGHSLERWMRVSNLPLTDSFKSISHVGRVLFSDLDDALSRGDTTQSFNNHLKMCLEEFIGEHLEPAVDDPEMEDGAFRTLIAKSPVALRGMMREVQKKWKTFNPTADKRFVGGIISKLERSRNGMVEILKEIPTAQVTDSTLTTIVTNLSEVLVPIIGIPIYCPTLPAGSIVALPPPPKTWKPKEEGGGEEGENIEEEGEEDPNVGAEEVEGTAPPPPPPSQQQPTKRSKKDIPKDSLIFLHSYESEEGKKVTFYVCGKGKNGKMLKIPQYYAQKDGEGDFIRLQKRDVPRPSKEDSSISQYNNTVKKILSDSEGPDEHQTLPLEGSPSLQ